MDIKQKYQNAEISTKITLTYAICFIPLLVIANAVTYFGVYYAFYRPANNTIRYSMAQVFENLDTLAQEKNLAAFNPDSIRKPLVAGVVLRVFDDSGNLLVDTDENYVHDDEFENCILADKSILADDEMDVAKVGNALVYRAATEYTFRGKHTMLYFYRTITSAEDVLGNLEKIVLVIDALGIIVAVAAGYFVSRKVLKPIKTMTEHAGAMAFGKMSGRLEIPNTNDELTELALTFNNMLDRIQDGIDKQQEFVIAASHELINPATAIFGTTEVLKKYGANNPALFNDLVDSISESVHSMESVIQNLLFIARADQDRQKLDCREFNLAYVVRHAVELTQIVSPNHEVKIVRNDDAKIFADEDMILQMLVKILDNAVKYSPSGGEILVSSGVSGGRISLSVADNGVGIAAENLEKIFERFFRVREVEDVEGGGLGLTIVRWIAEHHGIKIDVASELGKGTTFTLTIPQK